MVVCPIWGTAETLMVFSPVLGSNDCTTFCGTVSLAHSHWPLTRSIASMMPSLPVVTSALRVSPLNGKSTKMRS